MSAGRWLAVAAAALLGARLVTFTLADQVATSDPQLALTLDRHHAAALIEQAEAALRQEPPDLANAAVFAAAALRAEPLNARAVQRLARIAQARGDKEKGEALMRIAGAALKRDLFAQAALLDLALQAGDAEAAVAQIDVLFRGQHPNAWDPLLGALVPTLTLPQLAEPFARRLAAQPPWRTWLLTGLASKSADYDGLAQLYAALRQSPAPPTEAEWRPLLTRLVSAGRLEQAYVTWLDTLQPERLADAALFYNADFRYGVSNLPFDWVVTPAPEALVRAAPGDDGTGLLIVDFFGGRIAFQHIAHLLVLPPGRYAFSGRQRAERLENGRGLRWRLACRDDPQGALAETPLLAGDSPWAPFTASFTVPEACPAQILLLELPARVAREQDVSGAIAYAGLAITKD